jgi:outer membrane protein assembly factor BamB
MKNARLLLAVSLIGCGSGSSPGPKAAAASDAPERGQAPAPSPSAANILAPEKAPDAALAVSQTNPEFEVYVVNDPAWNEQRSTPPVRNWKPPPLAKRWATRVGKTTFRTTMVRSGDAIVIGTHGASLGGKNEASDGIYLLDAATGKQKKLIKTPGSGDLDIGGIAVRGDDVFFTADNATIGAASLGRGKILWTAAARGKVRPAPALADLNKDGTVDVVAGDEHGTLHALDGRNGTKLWSATTGMNEYDAKGFIGAAAIVDIGGDGTDDVIAGARDGILTAYRGSDGKVLWQQQYPSGIHASPSTADFDQDGKPEVLAAWSYGQVAIFDGRTGTPRWVTRLEQDGGGIEGLFGSPIPVPGKPGVLVAPTAWWGKEDGIVGVGVDRRAFRSYEDRVSASAVVTDLDGDGKAEAVIGTEKGKLVALTADGSRAVLATLGGAIEASALVDDVDGDGRYEILVASNDGMLTCFSTPSTAKPVIARFRGNSSDNRGDLGAMKLGWRSSSRERAEGDFRGGGSAGSIRIDYLSCCKALTDAATRAPAPENAELLRAAGVCNSLAAAATDRAKALEALEQQFRGKATMPKECSVSGAP